MDNNQNYNQNYNQQPVYNYSQPQQPGLPTSGKAIASMICGILSIPWLCCYIIPGLILAIVAVALAGSAKKDAPIKNPGMAKAGKICGIISIILTVLFILAIIICLVLGVGAGILSSYGYY